ncbi:MAG: tRNA (adenosine(37)-N6)-threonylcarbamoyltransferase complex dimerization subunit type 1 TsaB [Planctomycetes bacterium]|nr:tRNA (adenosine(37)-N6)-threonylcarbamoyltransferase complex dimerization subunit type 1 TsaB [Planctomycetota bacterium]
MTDAPRGVATLILETAFQTVSVATSVDGAVFVPRIDVAAARAAALHAAIADCLEQADLSPRDITHALIDVGPGSYTGLRVGLATIRTWTAFRPLTIEALFSTDLVAARAAAQLEIPGTFSVIADARRGQWFHARYAKGASGLLERTIEPDCVTTAELVDLVGSDRVFSAEPARPNEIETMVVGVPIATDALRIDYLAFAEAEPTPRYLMPAMEPR